MIYDQLGQTKLQVSKICLGTMTFGEQNTEAEGHEQLDYALDHGVNFIDTAEMYAVPGRKETQGSTEQIIGNWIAQRKNRDKFILATKVTGPSKMTWIRNPLRFTRKQITTAIEGSLQRLQTDYVDLYQLHWPERKTNFFGKRSFVYDPSDRWTDNFLDVLETLRDIQQAGKIRHFGISNETPWGTMRYLQEADKHDLPRCMSVQNPYSMLNRSYEVGMAEISIREKCGLLAYSPLAFGLLSSKYHEGIDTSRDRLNKFKQMSRYSHPTAREAASAYYELARENGISLAQMALAFVNSRPFVTSNIIGATTMQQLRENIASIDITLSDSIIQGIEAIQNRIPNPAP